MLDYQSTWQSITTLLDMCYWCHGICTLYRGWSYLVRLAWNPWNPRICPSGWRKSPLQDEGVWLFRWVASHHGDSSISLSSNCKNLESHHESSLWIHFGHNTIYEMVSSIPSILHSQMHWMDSFCLHCMITVEQQNWLIRLRYSHRASLELL